MKKRAFVYNPNAGKCKIKHCFADIVDVLAEDESEIVLFPTPPLPANAIITEHASSSSLQRHLPTIQVSDRQVQHPFRRDRTEV